jgi:hypothetical protein
MLSRIRIPILYFVSAIGLCFVMVAAVPVYFVIRQYVQDHFIHRVQYLMLDPVDGDLGNPPAEALLKEVRRGQNLIAAELDICYSVSIDPPYKDRALVNLKIDGDNLSGTGVSQTDKDPIMVGITRQQVDDSLQFTGSIILGSAKFEFTALANELDENELKEKFDKATDEKEIFTNPGDLNVDSFEGEASPNSLAVKISRDKFTVLIEELRNQNAKIDFLSLPVDCINLRSGQNVVRFDIAPMRSAASLDKIRKIPGVTLAGWVRGSYSIEKAVLVPALGWL